MNTLGDKSSTPLQSRFGVQFIRRDTTLILRNHSPLAAHLKGGTDRHSKIMSVMANVTVPLLFDNMMKIYFPSVDSDGFDKAFPQDKIGRISTKLTDALKDKPVDPTDKRHYLKEKLISEAWVSLFGCLLPRNPRSQRSVATARG